MHGTDLAEIKCCEIWGVVPRKTYNCGYERPCITERGNASAHFLRGCAV